MNKICVIDGKPCKHIREGHFCGVQGVTENAENWDVCAYPSKRRAKEPL